MLSLRAQLAETARKHHHADYEYHAISLTLFIHLTLCVALEPKLAQVFNWKPLLYEYS